MFVHSIPLLAHKKSTVALGSKYKFFDYWVILHAFLSSADFFKITFFENFLQEYHQCVKQFGPRSGRQRVGPDLGPNCLQKLSADDTQ